MTMYNTLTLDSEDVAASTKRAQQKALLFGVAGLLVCGAAIAAFSVGTVSRSAWAVSDAASDRVHEYNALDASPVNCDKGSDTYNQELPRCDTLCFCCPMSCAFCKLTRGWQFI